MRPNLIAVALIASLLACGCSKLERLTFVRPSTERGEYTKIAPTYDVSGRKAGARKLDANALVMAAADRLRRGDLAEAERLASQALKADARSADANTLLGNIAESRRDLAKAGKYYEAAVSVAPQNGIYANNYGNWLCGSGRYAESLGWFDRALADSRYPTPAFAAANSGNCARKAGMDMRAEASWRSALESQAGNVAALAGMAGLQYERGRYMEARAFAERWLAQTPNDRDALRIAADIEHKLGDNVASARYLSRLQALLPGTTATPSTQ